MSSYEMVSQIINRCMHHSWFMSLFCTTNYPIWCAGIRSYEEFWFRSYLQGPIRTLFYISILRMKSCAKCGKFRIQCYGKMRCSELSQSSLTQIARFRIKSYYKIAKLRLSYCENPRKALFFIKWALGTSNCLFGKKT